MRMVDQSASARHKRQTLAGLFLSLDGSTERALRQWAAGNVVVRNRVQAIVLLALIYAGPPMLLALPQCVLLLPVGALGLWGARLEAKRQAPGADTTAA
ncbi:hypothetical protein [Janthinobacterium sp.]|uniref:hypothetical protein n=1 Tax=Janthinobacterium sp. TaxID=1871054 RepID=UPI00293D4E04|nr:hypothetical protein [Janthinobacterium sp.]